VSATGNVAAAKIKSAKRNATAGARVERKAAKPAGAPIGGIRFALRSHPKRAFILLPRKVANFAQYAIGHTDGIERILIFQ
jgi:hypothetical protein